MVTQFLIAADALQRVQAFQNEFAARGQQGRVVLGLDAQVLRLLQQVLNPLELLESSSADELGEYLKVPPSSNHCTMDWRGTLSKCFLKTLAMAWRIISRATVSAPRNSPSYLSSSLPVREGREA